MLLSSRASVLRNLLIICALGWAGNVAVAAGSVPPKQPEAALACTVTSVHDGDTLRARCKGMSKTVRVRIDQIDAPELDQAAGLASRDHLRRLCQRGESVQLAVLGKDQYGRLLADARCNNQDVAAAQLKSGHAWVYTRYLRDSRLKTYEHDAKTQKRGLWKDHDPKPPWQFRYDQRH